MGTGIDPWGVAVVVGLYATFLGVGFVATRKVRAGVREGEAVADELLVAGRAMPLWIAVMTMTATWVDGGYLLGTAEYTYRFGISAGVQGGVCFGISLILGGLWFARKMREGEFRTMIDPFERRFGTTWAAVLMLPALLCEIFWSGALLVALGATFSVLLNLGIVPAILLSAAVVTAYTVVGGMWSVAYTDVVQLGLIPLGMIAAVAVALPAVGGLDGVWSAFTADRAWAARLIPPLVAEVGDGAWWTGPTISAWWDLSMMLILGGIPWNCYFQRVLSCNTPDHARSHSVLAGVFTIVLTIPPALVGMIAFAHYGADAVTPPSATLPRVLLDLTPYPILLLGLAAIVGAVTSSFSASILSAGSMFAWNVADRLVAPGMSAQTLQRVIRVAVMLLGALAAVLALNVKSVAALWLFTGDLVFVLLFPQLLLAMYDPAVNRVGSATGFVVALALRLGGGISVLTDEGSVGFGAVIPYASIFGVDPATWVDPLGASLLPVRTIAAFTGLLTIVAVSRLTATLDPPTPLASLLVQRSAG